MKNKIAHFVSAFLVYGISMVAITYMFYGKIDWLMTLIFAVGMGIADVLVLKKLRERKK